MRESLRSINFTAVGTWTALALVATMHAPSVTGQPIDGISSHTASSYPSNLTPSDGILFFVADEGQTGPQLWRSDGTPEGTLQVKAVRPDVPNAYTVIENLTDVNGTLFFTVDLSAPIETGATQVIAGRGSSANDAIPVSQTVALWKSDGTFTGTAQLHEFGPVPATAPAARLVSGGITLFLIVDDGVHGHEIWKSDGTASGTGLVKDTHLGPGDGVVTYGDGATFSMNGLLFFNGDDGSGGQGLWKSDGTEAGTVLVKSLSPPQRIAYSFAAMDGVLYFATNDYGTRQFEFWRSDGTADGTSLIRSIPAGVNSSGLGQLNAVGSTLFFVVADQGGSGGALWRSDGTPGGTALLHHFDIAPGAGLFPGGWLATTDRLFFAANCGFLTGTYLWKSDGTIDGTMLVSCNGYNGSYTSNLTALDRDTIVYSSATALWRSDGTSIGTAPVRLFHAPVGNFQRLGKTLFFAADDGQTGTELWKTDGTAAGTGLVKDINTMAVPMPTPTLLLPCVGDCDGNGRVTVDEILAMVGMALDGGSDSCPASIGWCNAPPISVPCILEAVGNALMGCLAPPPTTISAMQQGTARAIVGTAAKRIQTDT